MPPEIAIDPRRQVSPAAQLVSQIRRSILTDRVRPGSALPSARQLARDLDLDERVVTDAYAALARDAVISPGGARHPVIDPDSKTTLHRLLTMSRARDVHAALTSPVRITADRFEALGCSQPLIEVGGDLMDVVAGAGRTDLFLGDVAGHGLGAGLVMAMVKSAIRIGLRRESNLPAVLADVSQLLQDTTGPRFFATLACLSIDRDGRCEYVLAGHHHVAHYGRADGRLRRLSRRGLPLGLFAETAYESHDVALEPGDLLVVYTDGLNETTDRRDVELGHEAIEQRLADVAGRSLERIQEAVFETVDAYGTPADDRSLLLVRRTR